MDYSIDGEEDSHSPRTQEKPISDPQVLEKVTTQPPRSSTRLSMKSLTTNPKASPRPNQSSPPDARVSSAWRFTRSTSR